MPFTSAPKVIRYQGINLTREVKGLYSENNKSLLKEIEDITRKGKDIPCSWIGRTNIDKMSILPKTIYTCSAIPIQITPAFFIELEQTILKFVGNQKRLQIAKVTLKKKIKARGMKILDFKLYYKAVILR